MEYQIEIRDIEPMRVAYMRYKGIPDKYITEIIFPIKED